MYDPMKGFLNQIIKYCGGENQKFLASTTQALPSVVVVGVWLVLGYNAILFLSAMKDIPAEYYEAADIDGAGSIRKFFYNHASIAERYYRIRSCNVRNCFLSGIRPD